MKLRRRHLRRFSPTEIALHWSVVIPYLALAVSGIVLLLGKSVDGLVSTRELFVAIHKSAGVALIVFPLVVLVVTPSRPWAGTLLECLRFGFRDVLWLHVSAVRLIFPRVPLPRSGRFNAGQKLNLLHVAFLVPVVAATGVLLWAGFGAALAVRVVHAGLGLLSFGLACGHIYLAIGHPPTRRALGAMFHGGVDARYAEEHHPVWFESETGERSAAPPHRAPLVSFLARAAIVCAGAGAIVFAASPGSRHSVSAIAKSAMVFVSEPRRILEPAPLHPLHAADERLATCDACHATASGEIDDARCLACHEEIAARIREHRGYHARFEKDCASCHGDHEAEIVHLDTKAFNHAQALFGLRGAHLDLDCDRCHASGGDGRRRFVGLEFSGCESCHEDPHAPTLERSCDHCHEERNWRELRLGFDHEKESGFALLGAHRGASCDSCHERTEASPPRLRGTPRDCASCHDDPHDAPDAVCESCHGDTRTWEATRFDHSKSASFALDARHAELACESCHPPSRGLVFHGISNTSFVATDAAGRYTCESCHAGVEAALEGTIPRGGPLLQYSKPSPHLGKVTCAECHGTEPVATAACSSCHPRDYDPLYLEWKMRADVLILAEPAEKTRALRSAASHHWEGVVASLRAKRAGE